MSFTRIPNKTIDNLKLNPYQFQILSIIIRKTDGWCKTEDGISLSQFEKLVTFKKPKIINTLKELEKMGLIEKKKQTLYNNSNSFNLYKIGATLVTENNYPSNSELLPLVTEDYTQKKDITKETRQNSKSDIFERFINYLKSNCKYKSKVTVTKETKSLFNQIENKQQLALDYINHQIEKEEFSVRITKFLIDYETVYKKSTDVSSWK